MWKQSRSWKKIKHRTDKPNSFQETAREGFILRGLFLHLFIFYLSFIFLFSLRKIDFFSFYIFSDYLPFIRQIDHPFQSASYIKFLGMRKPAVIQNDCIKFVSRFKASNFPEKFSSSFCRHKENFF